MNFKKYLQSLKWNDFSTYPSQGENIFLHCTSSDGEIHRFVKVNNFNAIYLDLDKINKNSQPNQKWLYTWLPADVINYDND